ncbi:MAG: pyruvate formate lyase family protein [Candidatus Sulfotelmatobacter sp.]
MSSEGATTPSFCTKRLDAMKVRVRGLEHRRLRSASPPDLLAECEQEGLSWSQRSARLVRRMCEAEKPVILPDERIVFTRTTPSVPPIYSPKAWVQRTTNRTLHELGPISNICADWNMALSQGLMERRRVAELTLERAPSDPGTAEFLECAIETIDAVLDLCARYATEARRQGREDLGSILERVPARPARSFHEALQSLRILHAALWMEGHYHVGLGRLDQYLWPYLETDLAEGRLDLPSAEELLAEFFLTLNKDSDLYPGVQQGDNGQTIMLGGIKRDGSEAENELTRMALRVALYTNMIDPKVNLRITPRTSLDLLTLASELTRRGLGFPQYSNDDVVIPALVSHGYDEPDARDYSVAACWEFLIPGKGMEVLNIGAVSMPLAADRAIRSGLLTGDSFEGILARTAADIRAQATSIAEKYARLLLPPAPYYSVLMDGCLESGRDLSEGLKYNNFGVHGAGSSSAADALAAVKHLVFEERAIAPDKLLQAMNDNFDGEHTVIQNQLLHHAPKTGNDLDADDLLRTLFNSLAEACENLGKNGRGGRFRPGTGSAMYYVWLSQGEPGARAELPIGATADGRRQGEFFSANLAPSPQAQVRGPFSVLRAFSGIDYSRIYNGGPVTLELSESVFADQEGLTKCAMLVHAFAALGCQQLQLNTVNLDRLRDARIHPENHRNLIVRVWGWSGYFCELGPEYQEQIIARHLYGV